MMQWIKKTGPATLIAAAFIGPGTVTLCATAGVEFGLELLWVLVLAMLATIVLQEMAARLGIITGKGIASLVTTELQSKGLQRFLVVLILVAIVIGNAAYEAGNISGAIVGLEVLFGVQKLQLGTSLLNVWSVVVGGLVVLVLWVGNYKILERILMVAVGIMSVAFILTAIVIRPSITALLSGIALPSLPDGALWTLVGLIGTTIVPYNLFLHASLVSEKWKGASFLKAARWDTVIAISLGGIVSMAIVIAASAVESSGVETVMDLAESLRPVFGDFATYLLAIGLVAAGVTSAITAPLAAAYVVNGCLGWNAGLQSRKFRWVWLVIVLLGVVFSTIGFEPILIIRFAQIANGILLPVIVAVLLWMVNQRQLLGEHRNSRWQNFMGGLILLTSVFLGVKSIVSVLGLW